MQRVQRGEFRKGIFASFPIVLGYFPVAVTFGVTALAMGFSKPEVLLASAIIFAGASQFALISLMPHSFIDAIFIPIVLNLRHIIYSCVISRKLKIERPFVTAFGITDEVFATSLNTKSSERFIWGLEIGAYASWVLGTLVGIVCGAVLLSIKILEPSLIFSLTVLFFILLISSLERYQMLSALVGGITALLLHSFGYTSTGILLAGIVSPILVLKVKRWKK